MKKFQHFHFRSLSSPFHVGVSNDKSPDLLFVLNLVKGPRTVDLERPLDVRGKLLNKGQKKRRFINSTVTHPSMTNP